MYGLVALADDRRHASPSVTVAYLEKGSSQTATDLLERMRYSVDKARVDRSADHSKNRLEKVESWSVVTSYELFTRACACENSEKISQI